MDANEKARWEAKKAYWKNKPADEKLDACENVAQLAITNYRRRDSMRTIVSMGVDWMLTLGVVCGVIGAISWMDWKVCAGVGAFSGLIIGMLYALRVNGTRAPAAENLDFNWDDKRKAREAHRLMSSEKVTA
jgi:hypothetical protein